MRRQGVTVPLTGYAVVAAGAIVWWFVADNALAILLFGAVVVTGTLHLLRTRQGSDVRARTAHDRAEATARRGSPPPERPKGI
jgi:hypothetical protein